MVGRFNIKILFKIYSEHITIEQASMEISYLGSSFTCPQFLEWIITSIQERWSLGSKLRESQWLVSLFNPILETLLSMRVQKFLVITLKSQLEITFEFDD